MKTKHIVLTLFLVTSVVLALEMLAPDALAQESSREAREERRGDRQEGREDRRDDRQEARGDRGGDHELLRLALLAALRDGDFGDRQSVREERREGRQERRGVFLRPDYRLRRSRTGSNRVASRSAEAVAEYTHRS